MADEGQQERRMSTENGLLQRLPLLAKVAQVVFAIVAIGLIVDPMNSFQRIFTKPRFKLGDAAFIYVTVAGYIIINTILIISRFLGDRVPKRTLIIFSSVGAILHMVAGCLMIYNWNKVMGPYPNNEIYPSKLYMDMFISGSIFTFLIAVALVAEIFFTIKYGQKETY